MIGQLLSMFVLLAILIFGIALPFPALAAIQLVSALFLVLLLLFLEQIAKGLTWIENNTANGFVGIVGFLLLATGILIREGV
jgi:hypothetical protein